MLLTQRIDEHRLATFANCEVFVQRRAVSVTTPLDLADQRLMPKVECFLLSNPAKRFGVARVATFILRDDVPQTVELAMFSEEMLSAKA